MKVLLAKSAGFCAGVSRAVKIVNDTCVSTLNVKTFGEIVHNQDVVSDFEKKGVFVANSLDDISQEDTIIIRSHGVPAETKQSLQQRAKNVIDATCPNVLKIHDLVQSQSSDTIVILTGDPVHPEVLGILGHCSCLSFVVSSLDDFINLLDLHPEIRTNKVSFFSQTTFSIDTWTKIAEYAKKVCTFPSFFDTICRATSLRQNEVISLSKQVDFMVIVGGKHSSNTKKLYELACQNCKSIMIERASDLQPYLRMLSGLNTVGLTAGASTPVCIIQEVLENMANLEISNDMSFEEMIDASFKSLHNGERTTGIVTDVKPNEIFVDIGTKQAGYVPKSELTDDPNATCADICKVGDELELLVVRVNDVEGTTMLSKRRIDNAQGLEKVLSAKETGEVLSGVVTEVVNGKDGAKAAGIRVLTKGVKVFVPASQTGIGVDGDLSTLLRQNVQFKIIDVDRRRRSAVGSIRRVSDNKRNELAAKFWETVEEGKIYDGTVKSITNFGVFVDLGGVDGRISMNDLTWMRVKHPSEVVSVGDKIKVTVKDINRDDKKISLIYKKDEDNPWLIIKDKCNVGDVIKAKVMSTTDFGAFAQIIPGIDGLIHISQIARERVNKVSDKLKVGDEVDVKITELDFDKKRASLSMKALLPEEEQSEESAE